MEAKSHLHPSQQSRNNAGAMLQCSVLSLYFSAFSAAAPQRPLR
jgi:hypothetical protein